MTDLEPDLRKAERDPARDEALLLREKLDIVKDVLTRQWPDEEKIAYLRERLGF